MDVLTLELIWELVRTVNPIKFATNRGYRSQLAANSHRSVAAMTASLFLGYALLIVIVGASAVLAVGLVSK